MGVEFGDIDDAMGCIRGCVVTSYQCQPSPHNPTTGSGTGGAQAKRVIFADHYRLEAERVRVIKSVKNRQKVITGHIEGFRNIRIVCHKDSNDQFTEQNRKLKEVGGAGAGAGPRSAVVRIRMAA